MNKTLFNKNGKKLFTSTSFIELINNPDLRKNPRKLFGEYFYENEICILFSDSNTGKSLLATDICLSFQAGINNTWPEQMSEIDEPKHTVLLDLENSPSQFVKRLCGVEEEITNFERVSINPRYLADMSTDEFVIGMSELIKKDRHNLIVVDNLSCVVNIGSQKSSIGFMKQLKALTNKFSNLSILVLAHTPKRNLAKPLTQNDLGGSKMLMNFCDSAIGMSESLLEPSYRYIKHIKSRSGAKDSEVVILDIDEKPHVHFTYLGVDDENNHIDHKLKRTSKITPDIAAEIKELHKKGFSCREIADEVGVSKSTVNRFLLEYLLSDDADDNSAEEVSLAQNELTVI